MDRQTQKFLEAFSRDVQEQIGRLYTISITQTSALLELATALKNEKNVSPKTQVAADTALQTIEELIRNFDEAVAEIDKNAVELKSYVGGADE